MSLFLKDFVNDVHENAVRHGWWDSPRPIGEIIALIHSELSEALEEYRAKRPNLWFACKEVESACVNVCNPSDEYDCANFGKEESCQYRSHKPEGICIELIDAVIRIFDYVGFAKIYIDSSKTIADYFSDNGLVAGMSMNTFHNAALPDVIAAIHYHVSVAYNSHLIKGKDECAEILLAVAGVIISYVNALGEDAERMLIIKHEYNKERPYRHGGKAC